jgi:CheY-like chemotaxis protein
MKQPDASEQVRAAGGNTMSESKTLEALFPGARRLILSAMFAEPERWWSIPELAGRAGVQASSLRQHIVHFRDGGLVREKHDDGRVWFQPDPACCVFAELRVMLGKLTAQTGGGETILVVEDQPATAQITRILLESWGYRVLEAHAAKEAMDIFEQQAAEIRLLLTDVIMPELTGPQLADALVQRKPGLCVVFMSGYPADELAQRENTAFLPKPFNPASLSKMVRKQLDRVDAREGAH